jgi:hypothetical protein
MLCITFSTEALRFPCVGRRETVLHIPVVVMELGLNSTYYMALFSSLLKDSFSTYSKPSVFFPPLFKLGLR